MAKETSLSSCRKCGLPLPDNAKFCPACGAKQELPARGRKRRGNGQGSVYRRGTGWMACATRWEAGIRLTKTKSGFKTKKEGYDWLATVSFSRPKEGALKTFQQIYEEWSSIHYPTISKKKRQIYEGAYRKCAPLYSMKWNDVGIRHMQKIVNAQRETYYPRRDLKVLFSLMSQFAIVEGYSDVNYAVHIKLPPREKPHKEPFSEEEIQALWKDYEAGNEFTGAILIMIYTGMRYGEISSVKPENIHLEESYLLGGIKSEAGKEGEILLLDEIKPLVQHLMIDSSLGSMSDTTFRKKFDAALERAGCRRHTIHECRHTCATLLAKRGVQAAVITDIMRHASYSQTLDYTHIDRQTKLNALKSITDGLHTQKAESP